jgi:hypothetical protein
MSSFYRLQKLKVRQMGYSHGHAGDYISLDVAAAAAVLTMTVREVEDIPIGLGDGSWRRTKVRVRLCCGVIDVLLVNDPRLIGGAICCGLSFG